MALLCICYALHMIDPNDPTKFQAMYALLHVDEKMVQPRAGWQSSF